MHDPLRLAELLCARLCHDLSGPLGSLMGATELASEEAPVEDAALAVAAESAQALGARLRLLRAAWAGEAGSMDVEHFQDLSRGLVAGRRVAVDLAGLDRGAPFAPAAARVALNALLLGVEAVSGIGRLTMAGAADAEVIVTIEGPRAAWPAGLAAWIVDEQAAWQAITNARVLQGPLTVLIARRSGIGLSLLLPAGAQPAFPPPLLVSVPPAS